MSREKNITEVTAQERRKNIVYPDEPVLIFTESSVCMLPKERGSISAIDNFPVSITKFVTKVYVVFTNT